MTRGMSCLNLCVECVSVCLSVLRGGSVRLCGFASGHVDLWSQELCGSALPLYLCVCESEYLKVGSILVNLGTCIFRVVCA